MIDEHRSEGEIDPEVEEDGQAHLEHLLETDEQFRRVWESNRARRERELEALERRLGRRIEDHQAGELTDAQEAGYRQLKADLKEALPIIDRLGLRRLPADLGEA